MRVFFFFFFSPSIPPLSSKLLCFYCGGVSLTCADVHFTTLETSFFPFHLHCSVKTFTSWLRDLFVLTFDLALTHCAVLVFTAQVWKWRPTARWSEASRERPEYGVDGGDSPHGSSRNSLKRRPSARPQRRELCWRHPETARLSLI